jgi:hypothetical protein
VRPYLKIVNAKRPRDVVHMIEYLSRKCESLESIPSSSKKPPKECRADAEVEDKSEDVGRTRA